MRWEWVDTVNTLAGEREVVGLGWWFKGDCE